MHSSGSRIVFSLLLFITAPVTAIVAESPKSIKEGACTPSGVHVTFLDGTEEDFPAESNYNCVDFKIPADHRFAGWKFAGTLIAETDRQQITYPDATPYIVVEGKSYAATENARCINDWFFVPGRAEVVAETAFEHGPSTYALFDLEKKKVLETCGQLELANCQRLQKLVDADK